MFTMFCWEQNMGLWDLQNHCILFFISVSHSVPLELGLYFKMMELQNNQSGI